MESKKQMNLTYFKTDNFYTSLKQLFKDLNIPINYIDEKSIAPKDILTNTYKDNNAAFQLMEDVYILGMVEDSAFKNESSIDIDAIKNANKDYDGILIFGVTLKNRTNQLLPTRTHLAEITRAFNREFHYTPVVIVFKYADLISIANSERLKYKQEWREGEKIGKVSVLRDISTSKPHSGHLKILAELKITRSGKKGINSFKDLYHYWQEVFSVNILNKQFYHELSNWYFWAIKHINFPDDTPNSKPKNVIRLLTRLLFIWFIKEKKLIPEELFDLNRLQTNLLKKIEANQSQESIYYKAILQNLFFATLNCPIQADSIDNRNRGFRGNENYGKHRGVDYLMRYKDYFQNPDAFLKMVNEVVPFLNGGLFECLDDKDNNIYIDGFSDNKTKGHSLIVPDYLFFAKEAKADLSSDYGIKTKATKESTIKGLINILKSYKFTLAENTPIEEEVALDPELLGKVFENLLASYNPETKTTARKQTGSFYTPREIVNYMVEESLIAHLKNAISWELDEKELDEKLHQLVSFEPINPFENQEEVSTKILHSLDTCKILDPACGSGAFPMGILQKMVHILQKVDPDNTHWKELQREKAKNATNQAYEIDDKNDRQILLREIDEAFDESINNPDYARKLFLIENGIYGVDIQPIAIQISKLRFFISLVIEQKVNKDKENFGIIPLPNLETKFVTANTLIGIEKPEAQLNIFESEEVQKLETELKTIRHKLFGAKTKATKIKYRNKDEELRNKIAVELKKVGWASDSAEKLASWNPYDQNGSSGFFDVEWMFDIKDGFDVVIGNPPYVQIQKFSGKPEQKDWQNQNYNTFAKTGDIYSLFYEKGNMLLKDGGILTFITSNKWMRANYGKATRRYFAENTNPLQLIDFGGYKVFESATVDTNILIFTKKRVNSSKLQACTIGKDFNYQTSIVKYLNKNGVYLDNLSEESWIVSNKQEFEIKKRIEEIGVPLKDWDISIYRGVLTGFNEAFIIDGAKKDELIAQDAKSAEIIKPILRGRDIKRYKAEFADLWLIATFPALNINIDDYPAVKEYLEQFLPKIKQTGETYIDENGQKQKTRKKTGNKWFETQDQIAYYQEFEKEKIVWASVGMNEYCFVPKCFLLLDTNYFATGLSKYSLAILNSQLLINMVVKEKDTQVGTIAYRHYKYNFENFPVPKISKSQQIPFETLVDCILFTKEHNLNSGVGTFEKVIDALVFELYFPEHLKERKIDILQFIETDIAKVMQDRDFDTLSDSQKEQIIAKLHKRWSNPNSEIVKRINSFAEKSPDILKPILET